MTSTKHQINNNFKVSLKHYENDPSNEAFESLMEATEAMQKEIKEIDEENKRKALNLTMIIVCMTGIIALSIDLFLFPQLPSKVRKPNHSPNHTERQSSGQRVRLATIS
jgi:hypothetical protein